MAVAVVTGTAGAFLLTLFGRTEALLRRPDTPALSDGAGGACGDMRNPTDVAVLVSASFHRAAACALVPALTNFSEGS